MKIALASYGARGDVEPVAAVGLELMRRGHDACMAVPPNLLDFIAAAGLPAIPYGPNSESVPDFFKNSWRIQNPYKSVREVVQEISGNWREMSATLRTVGDGADILVTGVSYQESAASVAEHYEIPLAAIHHVPMRVNGQVGVPTPIRPPASVVRTALRASEWAQWLMTRTAEDAQRRELGLPKTTGPASRRMALQGAVEIQAYDALCFPGLAAEWNGLRPFSGALTMALPTDSDDEVMSWIAKGKPPIYFGFGSIPVGSPVQLMDTITSACRMLGQRALICAAGTDFDQIPPSDDVLVVRTVNFATVLPVCRAMVHHGGSGTTAAGLRAGIPAMVFWSNADQPVWAAQIEQLKVGCARRFSTIDTKSLAAGLRRILTPECMERANEIGSLMTTTAVSAAAAADLVEQAVTARA